MKQLLSYICLSLFGLIACTQEKAPLYNDPIPEHQSFKLTSAILSEVRTINVWLPDVYKSNHTDSLAVIYMPDGGVKEDFPHIANSLDSLISSNKIPAFILVGIENTERGRDLTGVSTFKADEEFGIPMTDGAKNFRAFIKMELIPEIDSRYRTTSERAIIGESLAGLFIMETFFLEPQLFDYYIAMDPSFWWNDNYLVKNAEHYFQKMPDQEIKLWFAGSSTEGIQEYTRELAEKINTLAPQNIEWKYSDEPFEEHHTIYKATKEKALIWTLNK